MNVYEIALPLVDNGNRPTELACASWEAEAMAIAGGFSQMAISISYWMDEKGKVFRGVCKRYQVACTAAQWRELVGHAFRLFPDQLALYHAKIGTATIALREEHAHAT